MTVSAPLFVFSGNQRFKHFPVCNAWSIWRLNWNTLIFVIFECRYSIHPSTRWLQLHWCTWQQSWASLRWRTGKGKRISTGTGEQLGSYFGWYGSVANDHFWRWDLYVRDLETEVLEDICHQVSLLCHKSRKKLLCFTVQVLDLYSQPTTEARLAPPSPPPHIGHRPPSAPHTPTPPQVKLSF